MKKAGKILLVIACVIGVAVGGVRLVPPRKRTGRTGGSHAPGHAEPEYQRGGHHIRGNPVQQGDPRRHAGRSGKGSCELSSFPIGKKRNVQSDTISLLNSRLMCYNISGDEHEEIRDNH